ncbi:MAG TPA: hypothetical protein VJ978_01950 [Nitriliruptoraceae bacterium]|nr:hypothetical protein [Nitriliruptoraceae bacterium]
MADFSDPRGPIDLGRGIQLHAPGLQGQAQVEETVPGQTRSASVEPATDAMTAALAASGMREQALVTADLRPVPGSGSGPGGTRGPDDDADAVVLDVPDPGEEWGQVLMAVHEGGVISWHAPRPKATSGGATRGGESVRFRVDLPELGAPVDEAARDDGDDPTTRGLIGMAGRVLLKALVFPIAKEVAGRATRSLVHKWEAEHRPNGLRWFGPSDDPRRGTAVDSSGIGELAQGRALLLVHGTFSTSATGFGQLSDEVVGRLARAYDGRLFTFEHPSVATSADENLAWLRDHLDGAPRLDLDVVTHSRGGLVGRLLAGGLGEVPELTVNTLVFGATPNHGTLLAQPDHVVAFLDRATTLLNLAPPGAADIVQAALEGILVGVKAIVAGALEHLTGLTGMNPDSPWLQDLNARSAAATSTTFRAIAANFEPTGALRRAIKMRVQDEVVDRVMGNADNDTVVPTIGVTGTTADPTALVADPLVYAAGDGVHHSNIFAARRTHEALEEWLIGATG